MVDAPLCQSQDLPLGRIAPDAIYNRLLAEAISLQKAGHAPSQAMLMDIQREQAALFAALDARKEEGLKAYGRFTANAYGFDVHERDGLAFIWKEARHERVGWESDYFTCDKETRSLVPVHLNHKGKRIILFATGRAFAERNARLLHLSANESLKNARNVMSAQAYLVESRLVPKDLIGQVQVVAVAYDMVTSEVETPALRIQSLLNDGFIHPVAQLAAERIFGPMLAKGDLCEDGTFVRSNGKIQAKAFPEDELIAHLSGLVLIGGSVGCCVGHQVFKSFDNLMRDLGISEKTRSRARRTFLCIHLGPTTVLPVDRPKNRISVINRRDEFVVAGNQITPIVQGADAQKRRLIEDKWRIKSQERKGLESYHAVLDAPSTIYEDKGELVFDPIKNHFGHSMKHYTNGLREMGIQHVVGRALKNEGVLSLKAFIKEAKAHGELNIAMDGA